MAPVAPPVGLRMDGVVDGTCEAGVEEVSCDVGSSGEGGGLVVGVAEAVGEGTPVDTAIASPRSNGGRLMAVAPSAHTDTIASAAATKVAVILMRDIPSASPINLATR